MEDCNIYSITYSSLSPCGKENRTQSQITYRYYTLIEINQEVLFQIQTFTFNNSNNQLCLFKLPPTVDMLNGSTILLR